MTLYVWEVLEEAEWGTVAMIVPMLGSTPVPLLHHKREVVDRLGLLARQHQVETGKPVRLVRYDDPDVLEVLDP